MSKKITWILFTSYFAVFVILSGVFYWKYSGKFLASGAEGEVTEVKTALGNIYYSQDNNLFRANPALVYEPSAGGRVERFQSTGQVAWADINKNGQKIAYDAKNSLGFWEIWQVDSETQMAELVATSGQEDLKTYLDFRRPKFSPEGTALAFIGAKNGDETLFIKDFANGQIKELLVTAGIKITDFSWSAQGESLIYCTSAEVQSACWEQILFKGVAKKIIEGEVLEIAAENQSKILYLAKSTNFNIYSYNEKTGQKVAITDTVLPRAVTFFQIDPKGERVTYEVTEGNLKNIYVAKVDGKNILQLTTDGQSGQPLFSPRADEIAFLREADGIYLIGINKENVRKITNLETTVKLLLWR